MTLTTVNLRSVLRCAAMIVALLVIAAKAEVGQGSLAGHGSVRAPRVEILRGRQDVGFGQEYQVQER